MEPITYKPQYLLPQEVVPPEVFKVFGERSFQFLDSRILWTIDAQRIYFNKPILVNNWHIGGAFMYRGFRPPACPVGATLGQHRFGRAIDYTVIGMPAEEVRAVILSQRRMDMNRYITAVELDTEWVHIDCRNTNSDQILTFTPGGV